MKLTGLVVTGSALVAGSVGLFGMATGALHVEINPTALATANATLENLGVDSETADDLKGWFASLPYLQALTLILVVTQRNAISHWLITFADMWKARTAKNKGVEASLYGQYGHSQFGPLPPSPPSPPRGET